MAKSHKELCNLALKWLKRPHSAGGPGCLVALSECKTGWDGEIPDAIGFRRHGFGDALDGSVLIEAKTSRADFLADLKKPHRNADQQVSLGIGSWRYYLAPEGLIAPEELPDRWGLLTVNARGHIKPVAGLACFHKGSHRERVEQSSQWRFTVDLEREQTLLVLTLAKVNDPQNVLERIREANNRSSQLLSRIGAIAQAIGMPKESSSYEVERQARLLLRRRRTAHATDSDPDSDQIET